MPAKRFQLSGSTLEAVQAKAAEFGPQARIVAADRVRVGGLLGSTVYQAVVEVPAADPRSSLNPLSASRREMLGALLADGAAGPAEDESSQGPLRSRAGRRVAPLPAVSTSGQAFASILDSLTAAADGQDGEHPAAAPPSMLVHAGDLVVLAGVGLGAVEAAGRIAAEIPDGAQLGYGGETSVEPRVEGDAGVLSLRARGVLSGQPAILAYGLGTFRTAQSHVQDLLALGADQLWLVVDAGRKHEDTKAWGDAVSPALDVTALAVLGSRETGTPSTARKLGLPVGWIDGPGG